jgi:hypothetical protein
MSDQDTDLDFGFCSYFHDNLISGTIPTEIFSALSVLGIFNGDNNSLTGELPSTLEFATELREL